MQYPVVTATTTQTIASAYETMQDERIRHLPVMDGDTLVGVVTDRDVRYMTSDLHPSPVEAEAEIHTIMTSDPIVAGPLDPVEEAARILRSKRIGCLPVLDGNKLVGIITVTNLLDAVIRLTGLEKPGGRVAVSLEDEPGQLARLTTRVADAGLDVRSVLSYYEDDDADDTTPERLRVILRLDTINVRPLAERMRDEGFDVVWPIQKPV